MKVELYVNAPQRFWRKGRDMTIGKPLPASLVKRYKGWKATDFEQNRAWFKKLATDGQHPRTMVISCCDSRVHVTSIFGAETGEFFIHRNIAALVPPYGPNQDFHGTSAAIEYAVKYLKVSNLMVVGHSGCGGVAACHDIVGGEAPEDLTSKTSFIGQWLEILKPSVKDVAATEREARLAELERNAVVLGLRNLMEFPFVREAVEAGRLDLHGLWTDVGEGVLWVYEADRDGFRPL